MKIPEVFKKTFLWIIAFPLFLFVQSLVIYFNNVAFTQTFEASAWGIERGRGFQGHLIQGPIFIFYSYSLAVACAMYIVVKIFKNYPKHGKIAFFVISVITLLAATGSCLLAFFASDLPFEYRLRKIVNAISFLFGTYMAAIHFKFLRIKHSSNSNLG